MYIQIYILHIQYFNTSCAFFDHHHFQVKISRHILLLDYLTKNTWSHHSCNCFLHLPNTRVSLWRMDPCLKCIAHTSDWSSRHNYQIPWIPIFDLSSDPMFGGRERKSLVLAWMRVLHLGHSCKLITYVNREWVYGSWLWDKCKIQHHLQESTHIFAMQSDANYIM